MKMRVWRKVQVKSASFFAAVVLSLVAAGLPAEVASAQASNNVLIVCANEGGTCIVPNTNTRIFYGKNGAFKTTSGVTQIGCNFNVFGGDPIEGIHKSCWYFINPSDLKHWTRCATEGGKCEFTGAKLVRYGAENGWVYNSFVDGVNCSYTVLGDPAVGQHKACWSAD